MIIFSIVLSFPWFQKYLYLICNVAENEKIFISVWSNLGKNNRIHLPIFFHESKNLKLTWPRKRKAKLLQSHWNCTITGECALRNNEETEFLDSFAYCSIEKCLVAFTLKILDLNIYNCQQIEKSVRSRHKMRLKNQLLNQGCVALQRALESFCTVMSPANKDSFISFIFLPFFHIFISFMCQVHQMALMVPYWREAVKEISCLIPDLRGGSSEFLAITYEILFPNFFEDNLYRVEEDLFY